VVKRSFKIIAELIAVIVAGLTVVVAFAAYRLTEGPISLDFLTPHIERGLTGEGGDFKVTLGGTLLSWSKADRDLDIVLREVRVTDKDGASQAYVPKLAIGLSVRALIVGQFRPTRFELAGPALKLVRGPDGQIAFGDSALAGPESGAGVEKKPADGTLLGGALTAKVVESLLTTPPRGHPLRYLRSIRFSDATLEFEDQANGFRLTSPGSALALVRDTSGIAVSARLYVTVDGERAPVEIYGGYGTAVKKVRLAVHFRNLVPARLAKLGDALAPLAGFDLPADGEAGVTMDTSGRIDTLTLEATAGPGKLVLKDLYKRPVPVRGLRIKASAEEGFQRFKLDHLTADLGGVRIGLSAEGKREGKITDVSAAVTVRDITVARLKRMWPEGAADGAREWIMENLVSGRIRRVDTKLALKYVAGEGDKADAVDLTSLDGGFDFTGVRVHYLKPMPAIEAMSGRARLTKTTFVIEGASGRTQGLELREGRIDITDLDKDKKQKLKVGAVVSGPLPAALGLLAHPRLDLLNGFGIDPSTVTGDMAARLSVRLPLLKVVTFDMIDVSAAANVKKVSIPKAALSADLTEGDLTLQVDKRGMDVSGTIHLGGVPAKLAWTENFYSGARFRGRYQVQGVIKDEGRKTLGLDSAPHVTGPVGFDLVITRFAGKRTSIAGKLNVADAALNFGEIEWRKKRGVPGVAQFSLNLIDDTPRHIPRLIVKAGDLAADGTVRLKADGITVESFRFPKLIFGQSDIGVDGKARADGGLDLVVTGKSVDIRPFLESRRRRDAKRPLSIEVDIDQARVGPGPPVFKVQGSLSRATGDWQNMSIRGQAGEKHAPVHVSISPAGTGRDLVITSNDAGATLKSFDVTEDMVGGELSIKGKYDDTKPGAPLSGTFLVRKFQMVRAPLMAKLLGVLSLDGILSALGGKGIAFDEAVVPFTKTGDDLRIMEAKAYGSALGFTAKGWMDLEGDTLDISGTVVPAYTLNKIVGWVPLLGDILVGEKGSGLFAATYRMHGPLGDPKVSTNPLAALAPGPLRELFGIFDAKSKKPPSEQKQSPPAPMTKTRPVPAPTTAPQTVPAPVPAN